MGIQEDNKINSEICNNIRQVRLGKNLIQAEVAKKAGLNSNYYAKVERGEAKPSGVTITKICKALGIKSSDILLV